MGRKTAVKRSLIATIALFPLAIVLLLGACATTILERRGEYALHLYRPLNLYVVAADNLMLGGHDPVAYFTEGKAVRGDPGLATEWNGVRWLFSNQEHRRLFTAEPEKYSPQYHGYCAWSVANNNYIPPALGDPTAWRIVDGRLYVIYDKSVRTIWAMDLKRNIERSEERWPAKLDLMQYYKPLQDDRLGSEE